MVTPEESARPIATTAATIKTMGDALDRAHQRRRDAEAQRDELVEALANIRDAAKRRLADGVNDQGWISASWIEDIARSALAKVRDA